MSDNALKPTASFVDFKKLTVKHANRIFGRGSLEVKAVRAGWKAAKI